MRPNQLKEWMRLNSQLSDGYKVKILVEGF